jgi:tetratricopeptide (TPR) repeat protein
MSPSAPLLSRAHALRTQGHLKDALSASVQAIHANPTDPSAWYLRALVLADLGEVKQALLSCERALVLDPEHQPSQTIRLALLARLEAPEALTQGHPASGHQPNRPTVPTAL